MSIHLNYYNYWGNYTWLCIYISKKKKILKIVNFFLLFLYILVYIFHKKRVRVPYLKPHFFSTENMPHFFHILNVTMYMMHLVCCFWIFNKKKRCRKSCVTLFIKWKLPPPSKKMVFTNLWIWTHLVL
jgi:hypothetical protein